MPIDERVIFRKIGQRLKVRRTQADMTQAELADAVNLTRTSITNLEAGRQHVPLSALYKVCAILGVEVSTILPTHAEVGETIKIEGVEKEVPRAAAEWVLQLQEELQENNP